MSEPVVTALGLFPILGLSVIGAIRGKDTPFQFHGIDIKMVVVADGAEPYVLSIIFPVRFGAAPFFPLPGDSITDMEMPVENGKNQRGGSPIAASVNGGRRTEHAYKR